MKSCPFGPSMGGKGPTLWMKYKIRRILFLEEAI
jgi:hypothetical protein